MDSTSIQQIDTNSPYRALVNVAFDEALVLAAGEAARQRYIIPAIVRLWSNPPAVVLGRSLDLSKELVPASRASLRFEKLPGKEGSSIPVIDGPDGRSMAVIRRSSGGGTVVHGPGVIHYSLCFSIDEYPELYPVKDSYLIITGILLNILRRLSPGRTFGQKGLSDISELIDGQWYKVAGQAQFRKKNWVCQHGSLICHLDYLRQAVEVLAYPEKVPDYRAGRSHTDFIRPYGPVEQGRLLREFVHDLSAGFFKGKENKTGKASKTGADLAPVFPLSIMERRIAVDDVIPGIAVPGTKVLEVVEKYLQPAWLKFE